MWGRRRGKEQLILPKSLRCGEVPRAQLEAGIEAEGSYANPHRRPAYSYSTERVREGDLLRLLFRQWPYIETKPSVVGLGSYRSDIDA